MEITSIIPITADIQDIQDIIGWLETMLMMILTLMDGGLEEDPSSRSSHSSSHFSSRSSSGKLFRDTQYLLHRCVSLTYDFCSLRQVINSEELLRNLLKDLQYVELNL